MFLYKSLVATKERSTDVGSLDQNSKLKTTTRVALMLTQDQEKVP